MLTEQYMDAPGDVNAPRVRAAQPAKTGPMFIRECLANARGQDSSRRRRKRVVLSMRQELQRIAIWTGMRQQHPASKLRRDVRDVRDTVRHVVARTIFERNGFEQEFRRQ